MTNANAELRQSVDLTNDKGAEIALTVLTVMVFLLTAMMGFLTGVALCNASANILHLSMTELRFGFVGAVCMVAVCIGILESCK